MFLLSSHDIVCVYIPFRHMKIHEKDPNSATAAAPPSPLKRRRLSSKRKLSHDAESEREDPAPAKKVLWAPGTGVSHHRAFGRSTSHLYFHSPGIWQTSIRGFSTCVFPHCFLKVSNKRVPVCVSSLEPPQLSLGMKQRVPRIIFTLFILSL